MKRLIEIFITIILSSTVYSQIVATVTPNMAATNVVQWQYMQENTINPDSSYIEFWKGFADFSGLTMVNDIIKNPDKAFLYVSELSKSFNPLNFQYQAKQIKQFYELYKNSSKEYLAGAIVFLAISHRAIRWDAIQGNTIRLSYIELELDNAYLKLSLPKKFYKDVMKKHGHTEFAIKKGKTLFLFDGEDYVSMLLLGNDWKKLTFNTKHYRFQTIGFNEFTGRNYKLILEVQKSSKKINGKPVYVGKAFNMYPLK